MWSYELNTHSLEVAQWVKASPCPVDLHRKKLPIEQTRVIHSSSPVAPREVCLSSIKYHIFTAPAVAARPFLRNCLSCSVGPVDIVAVAMQVIYNSEERLVLKRDIMWADTFQGGIVRVASDEHTWLMPLNTHKHLDVNAISETRCKVSACRQHKLVPVCLSLCVFVCVCARCVL